MGHLGMLNGGGPDFLKLLGMACLGTRRPQPPTPILPWKQEQVGKCLLPCASLLPTPPPCLAEPTLFSSLLYLLKKVKGVLFLLCIQIKEGDVIYLFI